MFEFTFDDSEIEVLNNLLMLCFEINDSELTTQMGDVSPPFPSLLRGDNDYGSEYSELDNCNSDGWS
jgi:hypothetical protein